MSATRGNSPPGPRRNRSRWRRTRGFNILVIVSFLVSAALLGLTLVQRDSSRSSDQAGLNGDGIATIAFFDVGQALSAAVVTDDGASLAYDFGLTRDGIEMVVVPFLRDHQVEEIDYAVLSHPHQDHVGGLPALLESMPIGLYLDPALETTNQTYLQSLEIIERDGIRAEIARQGESYGMGENVEFEILWPTDDLLTEPDGSDRLNDNSTVLRVTFGRVTMLLTGDIETEAEEILVETYGDELAVDILQVAHHGSNTSSQDIFLSASSPETAVIPVGADNQYGHPHTEVMQRLRQHEVNIYRTDVDGTVIIRTDGEGYEVRTTRTEQSWNPLRSLPRWTGSSTTPVAIPWVSWYSTIPSN